MTPDVIVSDLDETLCQTMDELQQFVWYRTRCWFPLEEIKSYQVDSYLFEFLERHDALSSEFDSIEKLSELLWSTLFNSPSNYAQLRPYYEIWQPLLRWHDHGLPLVFLTARPQIAEKVTREWLKFWGFSDYRLVMVGTKLKVQYLSALHDQYEQILYLEDRYSTAIEAAAEPGVQVFVPSRPWNTRPTQRDVRSSTSWLVETVNSAIARHAKTQVPTAGCSEGRGAIRNSADNSP